MSTRYYDVVVLGRSIGCLSAAALLARRGFRVLVFGQNEKPATYRHEGFTFRRRSFTLLAGSSPAWKRILQELGQTTTFKRRTRQLDPMFAVLAPERRIELPPDAELFNREVDREFSEVRQLVDELYATFTDVNAGADAAFERDAVWPPGTFWERLETRRLAATLPLLEGQSSGDLLSKFPPRHPYRDVVALPASFGTDVAAPGEQLAPFALARLHGSWTRGVTTLGGDEDELTSYLVARIEAHGGECHLDRKAGQLIVRRNGVAGVLEDGEEEPIGTAHVVTHLSGELVAELAGGEGIHPQARRDWPRLTVGAGRFVVSMVIRDAGLPAPLPRESFLIPENVGSRRPVVHLQRRPLPLAERADTTERRALLVAESVLPTRGPLTLLEAREAVLSTVRSHLPFIDEHLLAVDSPHDGLPLIEHTAGGPREIDRIHLPEGTPGPEPMQWQWTVEPAGYLGLAGEPVRGPITGSYLVGKTVLPALGQEGELIAAWGAARVITRKYGRRQKMRSQLWSKIETT